MRTRILADAEEEFREAARYYELKAPGVGMAFIAEVHRAVEAIVLQPNSAPEVRSGIRKKVLRHYPHSVIYAIEGDVIVIIAVAHHKRRPTYWQKRLP